MSTASFTVTNTELDFIDEIVCRATNYTDLMDPTVYASRGLYAGLWEPIAHSVQRGDKQFTLKFEKPCNAHNFRIDVQAAGPLDLQAFIKKSPHWTPEEARLRVKQQRMVFVGCARQCAANIGRSVAKLAQLGQAFSSYKIIIFENDSSDGTPAAIMALAEKFPIELISEPGLGAKLQERTARLAYARNRLLERALTEASDYICFADLDGPVGDEFPSEAGFLSNFQKSACWDAVMPVNAGMYYDIWALRHPVLCPTDFMTLGTELDAALGRPLAVHFAASYLQVDWRGMTGWLPVDSAFGGMAIYKASAFSNARYTGILDGREVCEHVPLHQAMRRQGMALYVNPAFVVASHG
ncbi:glycosyltransferase [Roseateles koreensis]|uniref:Glycosyltransferase 2-like domain-containing protein n=1 Tax=Roseateles koreensis TaxID=2987526 RepID=A0ABT5KYP5_9BURK|nr:glycosyltransferase [Roseateles koreensis]MDC8786921.1 hypothetical protein [Roseateles koreensis]